MQKRFILPLILLFSFSKLFSQPVNDNCNAAVTVVVSANSNCGNLVSGTTVNATQSMAPCSGTVANDVWYQFVATKANLTVNLSTAMPSPIIEVFSGTCGSLTSLVCIDQAPHNNTVRQLVKNLIIGNTYYLRVYSKQTGFLGATLNLCVYEPPDNDDCSGATAVTINTGTDWTVSTAGNNYQASPSMDYCNATATNDGDTWFKFVALDSVQLIYITQPAATPNRIIQTYSGDCNNLTVLNGIRYDGLSRTCYYPAFSDGYYKLQSLVAGNTYYIRVMEDLTAGGNHLDSFHIFISNPAANDACGAAVDVPVNNSTVSALKTTGNMRNASVLAENIPKSCTSSTWDDVWYKFTATSTRHIIALQNRSVSSGATSFEVYSGDCSSLQSVLCAMGSYAGWRFADISNLTIGNTYYIRVFAHLYATDSQQDQLFDLSITTPDAAVSNIDCASANALAAPVVATTLGTPSSQTWYSFVAPYDGYAQVEMDYASPGPMLKIYSGACSSQTLVVSGNSASPSLASFTVQSGQTYYASVTASGGSNTNYAYRLALNSVIALPVHLLSFTAAVADSRYVSVDWKTAEESDLDRYEVERSTDGLRFSSLGAIPAKNSPLPQNYHFEDASPAAGSDYYRLKIVNRDGSIDYSQVTVIAFKERFTDNLQLFKNGNLVVVKNNTNEIKNIVFNLYNAQGQLLGTKYTTVFPGTGTMDMPAVMNSGNVYFIKATIGGKDTRAFSLLW